ncbi:MAG: YidC/Oxa1 family membrane protein insertase [Candidatus Magasanikbacteria bacterium]
MIIEIWNTYLYEPMFNLLIWMYNNWTEESLGWAVIYLTIMLRIALLPFTVISERSKIKNQDLYEDVEKLAKEFQNDPVLQKEEIRKALKNRKVQPWAKSIALGIQALFLVLLYQVFLRGVTGEKVLRVLYDSIEFPGVINTYFYGFDLGARHDVISAGIVACWLAIEIYLGTRKAKAGVMRADLAYFILFPLTVFLFLFFLPMVKALFVLTSMVFTGIVRGFLKILMPKKKSEEKVEKSA